MSRWRIRITAAFLCLGAVAGAAPAGAGEPEARRLIADAAGAILVITWSPLNVMRLDLRSDGIAVAIGMGLRHCDGPHPARWRIRDGMLCLATRWSEPCFTVDGDVRGYALKERGERPVTSRIEAGPLGGC
ncbi:MAG: hypothetical protein AB7K86_05215 [Rhodospirillales bacterium]